MQKLNKQLKVDATLDVKGLSCPLPAVKTAIYLEKLEKGQILEVITTDEVSKTDLPAWCEETGNILVDIIDQNDAFHIYIKKH
jgi:TusA-related sulfurtransferase